MTARIVFTESLCSTVVDPSLIPLIIVSILVGICVVLLIVLIFCKVKRCYCFTRIGIEMDNSEI